MNLREPLLKPVRIADLRPTQITLGFREVDQKRRRFREEKTSEGDAFLGRHMIPCVLGPKGRHYIIDNHHLARALQEEDVEEVLVSVAADLTILSKASFWTLSRQSRLVPSLRRRRPANRFRRHPDLDRQAARRSLPQSCRGPPPCRRLRQGHRPLQRVPVGRFPAPPHQGQGGAQGFRRRAETSGDICEKQGGWVSPRLVRGRPDRVRPGEFRRPRPTTPPLIIHRKRTGEDQD